MRSKTTQAATTFNAAADSSSEWVGSVCFNELSKLPDPDPRWGSLASRRALASEPA